MQREPAELAYRWFDQASADLDAGRRTLEVGISYLACFLAQQAAEKALKAVLYWQRGDRPRVHVIEMLLRELPAQTVVPPALEADAQTLDKYYTTTRYPDSLDFALPALSFNRREAEAALEIATDVVHFCATQLPERPSEIF